MQVNGECNTNGMRNLELNMTKRLDIPEHNQNVCDMIHFDGRNKMEFFIRTAHKQDAAA